MTRGEFFSRYCRRSGVAEDQARALRWHAEPCACGEPGCAGWQMVTDPAAVLDASAGVWVPAAALYDPPDGDCTL